MLPTDSERRPRVTIAICTYNRAHLLDGTLDLIERLAVPDAVPWEVVVVDNASTDSTADVLRSHAARAPIRTFLESKRGLSHARNRCVAEARGEWILFTDDDVRVQPDWLAEFAAAVDRHPEVLVAGGPVQPWFPVEPDADLLRAFPELASGFCGIDHAIPEGRLDAPREVYGANFAVRRSVFDRMLFNVALGVPYGLGEETDLVRRVREEGGTVLWIPSIPVQHYVDPSRMTLEYLRRYRSGMGSTLVRQEGLPPARQMFGVPLWLLRRWLTACARAVQWRLMGRPVQALEQLRDASYYEGMIAELRAEAARPDGPTSTSTPGTRP